MKELFKSITMEEYISATKKYKGNELISRDAGVYFIYGIDGKLIYIGWTNDFSMRIRSHVNNSHFKEEITGFRIFSKDNFYKFYEKYPEINDVEYFFISLFKPKYNKQSLNYLELL